MKVFKLGNTTLKFNESIAARTEEEKKAVLDEAAAVVRDSLVRAAISKTQNTA